MYPFIFSYDDGKTAIYEKGKLSWDAPGEYSMVSMKKMYDNLSEKNWMHIFKNDEDVPSALLNKTTEFRDGFAQYSMELECIKEN